MIRMICIVLAGSLFFSVPDASAFLGMKRKAAARAKEAGKPRLAPTWAGEAALESVGLLPEAKRHPQDLVFRVDGAPPSALRIFSVKNGKRIYVGNLYGDRLNMI